MTRSAGDSDQDTEDAGGDPRSLDHVVARKTGDHLLRKWGGGAEKPRPPFLHDRLRRERMSGLASASLAAVDLPEPQRRQ